MAGQSITRQQMATLHALTAEQEAEAFEFLATVGTVRKLAKRLEVGLIPLYRWRDELPERQTMWANALRFRADYLADEGLEIVDDAEETNEGVAKARMRADYRKWLAGVSNPERYQAKPATAVQINIGSLHLEAVRLAGQERVRARIARDAVGIIEQDSCHEYVTVGREEENEIHSHLGQGDLFDCNVSPA